MGTTPSSESQEKSNPDYLPSQEKRVNVIFCQECKHNIVFCLCEPKKNTSYSNHSELRSSYDYGVSRVCSACNLLRVTPAQPSHQTECWTCYKSLNRVCTVCNLKTITPDQPANHRKCLACYQSSKQKPLSRRPCSICKKKINSDQTTCQSCLNAIIRFCPDCQKMKTFKSKMSWCLVCLDCYKNQED